MPAVFSWFVQLLAGTAIGLLVYWTVLFVLASSGGRETVTSEVESQQPGAGRSAA